MLLGMVEGDGMVSLNGVSFVLAPGDRYVQAKVDADGRVVGAYAWGDRPKHRLRRAARNGVSWRQKWGGLE